jgi:hypothetical protein
VLAINAPPAISRTIPAASDIALDDAVPPLPERGKLLIPATSATRVGVTWTASTAAVSVGAGVFVGIGVFVGVMMTNGVSTITGVFAGVFVGD